MPAKSNVTLCLVIAVLASAPATAAFSQATASKMDGVALSMTSRSTSKATSWRSRTRKSRRLHRQCRGYAGLDDAEVQDDDRVLQVIRQGRANNGGAMANAGNGDIDRILVNGGVVLNSDKQTATAESGHFEMAKQLFVLEGKQVVLSDGNNVFTGCRLTVHMDTGQAQLDSCGGRVQIQLDPNRVASKR